MWLTGRLAPDFKTIADFRKDNGAAIRAVCGQFVELCRQLKLFTGAVVAIDGSKFKAVNNRDQNYTMAKVTGRMEQVNASIARYLRALGRADREESDIAEAKSIRLKEKIAGLRQQMQALKVMEQRVQDAPDQQVSLTDPDARSMATSGKGTATVGYNVQIAVDATHHLIVAHALLLSSLSSVHLPGARSPASSASRRSAAIAGPCEVDGRFGEGAPMCARCSTWRSRCLEAQSSDRRLLRPTRRAGQQRTVALIASMRKLLTILNAMTRA